MRRKAVCVLVTSVSLVAMRTVPVLAHHSHVAYEPVKLVSVEGVVSEVKWTNPHMWIIVDVPGKDGKIEHWGFENAGTASAVNSGLSPQVLKVGNKVKVVAHPSKDPKKTEGLFMGIDINGKFYARGYGTNIKGSADF